MLLFLYTKESFMLDGLIIELTKKGILVDEKQAKLGKGSKYARKNHNKRKLSDDNVRAIRRMVKKGHSYFAISKRFEVNATSIKQIAEGITYKDVI